MHPFLQAQNLSYDITVVEQAEEKEGETKKAFNRAKLFNAGFAESVKDNGDDNFCALLHDVDLIPLDGRNVYACTLGHIPRHLTANLDVFRYNLMYEQLAGGAVAVTAKTFRAVNGFSNLFFGKLRVA
jgi:hypothetical protein